MLQISPEPYANRDPAIDIEELRSAVLASYADEYKDLSDTWKALDAKAQATTGLAGVFLAAIFAWVRDLPPQFDAFYKAVLCLCVFCLILSIGCAVSAMFIRAAARPPYGIQVREMLEDMTREGFSSNDVPAFVRQQMSAWEEVNHLLVSRLAAKADDVQNAQVMLAWAGIIAGLLAIMAITRG